MLANQKGSTVIEMIPIMIIVALLVNYSIGFFGVIHTGILNSMAARNYAFETFQHRSNLRYFREGDTSVPKLKYDQTGNRYHAVSSEKKMGSASADSTLYATSRKITMGPFNAPNNEGNDTKTHDTSNNDGVGGVQEGKRNTNIDVAPVWVKSAYGICLTYNCRSEQF